MKLTEMNRFGWNEVDPNAVYKFHNCRILRDDRLEIGSVYVKNGVILDPHKLWHESRRSWDVAVDLGGNILSPGFVDIQINGGFGIDFTNDLLKDSSALVKVAGCLLTHGVTSFCPTIVTSSPERYKQVLKNIFKFEGESDRAGCLGAHLEGPFINICKKGAHEPIFIAEFEKGVDTVVDVYGDLSNVALVTLAPEKNGSGPIIKYLKNAGVSVSMGHSNATYEVALEAVENGVKMVTHLFNCMTSFHHRNPGIIGLLGNCPHPMYFGVVADDHHTHSAALRLAHKSQLSGIVLTTDATMAMGLGDGVHLLGSKKIDVQGTKAVIEGTDTLSGSVTPMYACVKNYLKATDCSLADALLAATKHPAEVLGIHYKKGCIRVGADADFVVVDDNLNVISTWIKGRMVYDSPN